MARLLLFIDLISELVEFGQKTLRLKVGWDQLMVSKYHVETYLPDLDYQISDKYCTPVYSLVYHGLDLRLQFQVGVPHLRLRVHVLLHRRVKLPERPSGIIVDQLFERLAKILYPVQQFAIVVKQTPYSLSTTNLCIDNESLFYLTKQTF